MPTLTRESAGSSAHPVGALYISKRLVGGTFHPRFSPTYRRRVPPSFPAVPAVRIMTVGRRSPKIGLHHALVPRLTGKLQIGGCFVTTTRLAFPATVGCTKAMDWSGAPRTASAKRERRMQVLVPSSSCWRRFAGKDSSGHRLGSACRCHS